MEIFIKPASGVDFGKLEPMEALYYAMCLQAIKDIKKQEWKDGGESCSIKDGLSAVDYLVGILIDNGYNNDEIATIFREITPHNYKLKLITERLHKRGIEL